MMTKVLLGFQVFTSSLIHLLCCGLPLLLSIGGGLGIFMAIQAYTSVLFVIQLIVFGLTFYQLYKPAIKLRKGIRNQRLAFWFISVVSIILFFYPPLHWFKSEETQLKQAQMERFFKNKTR